MDEISLKVNYPGLYLLTNSLTHIRFQTYDALAYHVSQSTMNRQRIKTVSLWSLQMTASAIVSALKNMMDPVSINFRDAYVNGHGLYDSIQLGAAA